MTRTALLLSMMTLAACGETESPQAPAPPPPLTPGTVADGVYRHDALGLTMKLPAGWFALPRAQVDRIAEASLREFELGDAELRRDLDRAARDRVFLFVVREHGPRSQADFSAAMMAIAHRIGAGARFQNARQYLEETRRTLERTTQMKVSPRVDRTRLGSSDFQHFSTELKVADRVVRQDYFAIMRRNQAIGFVLSHDGGLQRAAMIEALQSIRLED